MSVSDLLNRGGSRSVSTVYLPQSYRNPVRRETVVVASVPVGTGFPRYRSTPNVFLSEYWVQDSLETGIPPESCHPRVPRASREWRGASGDREVDVVPWTGTVPIPTVLETRRPRSLPGPPRLHREAAPGPSVCSYTGGCASCPGVCLDPLPSVCVLFFARTNGFRPVSVSVGVYNPQSSPHTPTLTLPGPPEAQNVPHLHGREPDSPRMCLVPKHC